MYQELQCTFTAIVLHIKPFVNDAVLKLPIGDATIRTKVIGSKAIRRLINQYSPMDCSSRIKFYPSKFLDKVMSIGIIVRISEYAARF